jgi:hypothetical protein
MFRKEIAAVRKTLDDRPECKSLLLILSSRP